MKMQQASPQGWNFFTGYGDGHVLINARQHEGNLIVTADSVTPWPVRDFESLTESDFDVLLTFAPEVVLFGTGKNLRFSHPRLSTPLTSVGIGVETMDTQSACRTFNILLAEDRRVAVALLAI